VLIFGPHVDGDGEMVSDFWGSALKRSGLLVSAVDANLLLTLTARGLPLNRQHVFVLWAGDDVEEEA
jgi:hypothetical protein